MLSADVVHCKVQMKKATFYLLSNTIFMTNVLFVLETILAVQANFGVFSFIGKMHLCLKNNFPLIETLLECGANGSIGKTSNGSQVLHVQAEKADELDLSNLYPDAHIVSVLV